MMSFVAFALLLVEYLDCAGGALGFRGSYCRLWAHQKENYISMHNVCRQSTDSAGVAELSFILTDRY